MVSIFGGENFELKSPSQLRPSREVDLEGEPQSRSKIVGGSVGWRGFCDSLGEEEMEEGEVEGKPVHSVEDEFSYGCVVYYIYIYTESNLYTKQFT